MDTYKDISKRSKIIVEQDSILRIIISWIIFINFCLIITIVFIPLRIWKYLIMCYSKLYISGIGNPLTGYDSIFAIDKYYETPYAGNVTLFKIDGNININTLKNGFIQNVLSIEKSKSGCREPQYDKLYQAPTVIGGYYFWKNLNIDIHKQIRKVYTFKSDDHENELNQILGNLMTSPFPEGCPLWELLLYSGYKKYQSVIVFRLHHTLGDGYTFNHLVDQMIQKKSSYLVKNVQKGFGKKVELLLTAGPKLCKLYWEAFTHKDYYTQTKLSKTGVVSMTTINLDTLKTIRRATNTHFATVGMSILSGALRRYFLENKGINELPPYVSIMHSLPRSNHPLNQMVNHWGIGIFKIPMDTENPLDRLQQAEQNFESYIDDQYKEIFQYHVPVFNLLPEPLIRLFFKTNFGTGMGFTSVPAYEKEALLFGEYKIQDMFKIFGFQWAQTAVAAAVYTHNGKVSYTIFVNKDIVPDQEGIDRITKEYLHIEVQELLQQCGLQTSSSNTQSKPTSDISMSTTITKNIQRHIRTEGFA